MTEEELWDRLRKADREIEQLIRENQLLEQRIDHAMERCQIIIMETHNRNDDIQWVQEALRD